MSSRARRVAAVSLLSLAFTQVSADNNYVSAGDAQVSAQQMFLGQGGNIYIVDKTENNPGRVGSPSHPAWAAEFSVSSETPRFMDVITNSFCAGGIVLGNGTWLNVGGNQPVGVDGLTVLTGVAPYYDTDDKFAPLTSSATCDQGNLAVRLLDPCTDGTCQWQDNPANYMSTRRWYPSLETLPDGSGFIVGGEQWGGFVNEANQNQNNPTYEIFPGKNPANRTLVTLQFLTTTQPANLYPLTWLLPSGLIFMQANWGTELLNLTTNQEITLPNITHAVRTYPASGATAMLPLTPANNYTATILFCGGADYASNEWAYNTSYYLARENSASCVQMTPDVSQEWVDNDDQPQGRSMGQFIILPDQRLFLTNGIAKGVAGYSQTDDVTGTPYGTDPVFSGAYFNASAPTGQRWSTKGVGNLTYPRMYHSSATLLPDGSVFVSGSNPYPDFIAEGTAGKQFWTETRNERFLPDYFSKPRPTLTGVPTSLTYGGSYFNLSISASDLANVTSASQVKAVIIRTGFSTHAMNFGQKLVELSSSMTGNSDGSATLHVSQIPSPTIFQPGPGLFFLVVDGVPSNGTFFMAGSGAIETQTVKALQTLPATSGLTLSSASNSTSSVPGASASASPSGTTTGAANKVVPAGFAGDILRFVAGAFAFKFLI